MAMIFRDNKSKAPHLHAFIIGIGGYTYLQGGSQEKPDICSAVGQLKQLTSPPRSAIAFAEFILKNKWVVPIGSVDLLLSFAPNDNVPLPAGWKADSATINNIRRAYIKWKDRCNRDSDNIAMFYFCGHGVEKTELILLAEDFGKSPNPWNESFGFTSTRGTFQGCSAKTQCFFVDACRQVTSAMLVTEPTLIPLEVVSHITGECENNLTILGTARRETAHGARDNVAYFTQALIKSFEGAVATLDQTTDQWRIESGELGKRISEILGKIKTGEDYKQRCSIQATANTTLLFLPDYPKVDLSLECKQPKANPLAAMSCNRIDHKKTFSAQHNGAPWTLQVEAGFYEAAAQFTPDGAPFHSNSQMVMAFPPGQQILIEV